MIGRNPQWDLGIEFDAKEMTSDTPTMGIIIGVSNAKTTLSKQHLPVAFKGIDFSRHNISAVSK